MRTKRAKKGCWLYKFFRRFVVEGKVAKEYLMIADLMEYHFDKGEE